MKKVIFATLLAGFTSLSAADGASLYKKCSACHGANGEKSALGKSQVISGWSKDRIVKALQGYKKGTYGGAMRMIMKGQVVPLNDAQINALADYISNK